MNKYEIMFIVKSDMEEAEIKKTADDMKKILTDNGANILEEKVIGQRELAYEIKKMKTGYYFQYIVEADKDTIREFNRVSGINENILRHLIVKSED